MDLEKKEEFQNQKVKEEKKNFFVKFLQLFMNKDKSLEKNTYQENVNKEESEESLKEKRASEQLDLLINNEMFLLLQQLKENGYILNKEQENRINKKMWEKISKEGFNFLEKAKKEGIEIPNNLLALFIFSLQSENIIINQYEIDKEEKRKEELRKEFSSEEKLLEALNKEKLDVERIKFENMMESEKSKMFEDFFRGSYQYYEYDTENIKKAIILKKVKEYIDLSNIKEEFNTPYNIKYINNLSNFKRKEIKSIEYLISRNEIDRSKNEFIFLLLEEKCKDENFKEEMWSIFKETIDSFQKKLNGIEKLSTYKDQMGNIKEVLVRNTKLDYISTLLLMTNYIVPNIKDKIDFYEFLETTDKIKKIKDSFIKIIKKPIKEYDSYKTNNKELEKNQRKDGFIHIKIKNEKAVKEIQSIIYHLDSSLKDLDYLMHNFFSIEKGGFIKDFIEKKEDIIKLDNLELLPEEAKQIVKEIQAIFLNYTKNKGILNYVEELEIEGTINNKIPYVIDKYLKLHESHRDTLKNAEGKTANNLLKEALSNILVFLEEKNEKINELLLSELSVAQRGTALKLK